MSPRIQPLTLKINTCKVLAFYLIHAMLDEEHLDTIQKYLFSASYNVLEMLQDEILNLNLAASIRFNSLLVLLREDVKRLETGMFPRFYYDKILVTITQQGQRLQELSLKGVWARDYPQLLSNMVENLKELKCLEMPHMADDTVISSISKLKNLTRLDISGEGSYSKEGIRALKSKVLKVLDIGSFGKQNLCFDNDSNFDLVAELIENLPNLSVLKTYSFTGHALFELYKKNPNFRSKLTYIYDSNTSLEIFDAICALCPLLESAYFNAPREGVVKQLHKLKKLNSLKLTQANKEEFVNFLHKSENRMEVLQLNHNRDDVLDLGEFCRHASNLKETEFFQLNLKFVNLDDLFFINLQKVHILYCDISDREVMGLMLNSPRLKSITIGSPVNFSDEDMFILLSGGSLQELEELVFNVARNLTILTIELLCTACTNLKFIGVVTEWSLTSEEIIGLKYLFHSTNTDLTLLPMG